MPSLDYFNTYVDIEKPDQPGFHDKYRVTFHPGIGRVLCVFRRSVRTGHDIGPPLVIKGRTGRKVTARARAQVLALCLEGIGS